VDLNGSTSATGVDPNATITISFTDDVAPATATNTNVSLKNTSTGANVPMSVTASGSNITAKPDSALGYGIQYTLSISGVTSQENVAVSPTSRTFTTAGAFAPPGAIAYWPFDGNANDAGGVYNAVSSTDITYVAGRNATAGQAAQFNGTTSIVEMPNGGNLITSTAFSISLWTFIDSTNHHDSLGHPNGYWVFGLGFFHGMEVEVHNNFTMNFVFHISSSAVPAGDAANVYCGFDGKTKDNGGWQGTVSRADLTSSGGPASLLANKWAHIVCTYDVATQLVNVYVNGTLMESDNLTLWPSTSPEPTATGIEIDPAETDIGHNLAFGFGTDLQSTFWQSPATEFGWYASPYAEHYQGMLDDIRIYHRALAATEVSAMYNSGK
jgi:Bacterial Ig-like domain/Concanavalin A-like lectin/glucanases superfamily